MKFPAVTLRRAAADKAVPPAGEPPRRRRRWVRGWRRGVPLRRRLWNLLRRDSWLKVLSVVLACFVWYSINELERDAERLVELPVAIRKVPSDLIVTDLSPAKGVTVTLRGPRTILDSVDEDKTRLVVDLSRAGAGRTSVDLNRAVLAPELPRRLKAVRMSPIRLHVKLERLAKRRLPVVAPLAGAAAVGYTAQITVTPDHVEVTGPASTLRSLTDVSTRRVDVSGLSSAFERSILLEPAGDFVSLVPDRVQVAVRFTEKVASRTFERVPIALRNGRASRIEPSGVTLTVRGPELALSEWKPPEGAVFVDAAGLQAGAHDLPVQVDLPAPLEITKRAPESVRVVVVQPSEGGGE